MCLSLETHQRHRRVRFAGGASMRTQIEKKVQSVSFECAQWEHLINNNNNNNERDGARPGVLQMEAKIQWKRDRMCELERRSDGSSFSHRFWFGIKYFE